MQIAVARATQLCRPNVLTTANNTARTFSCYRVKPKCNFVVRPLYDGSTMLARLLQTVWGFFLEKKQNIVWEFAKFETMVRVELLGGFWCVTRVGAVFFGKIPWRTSP